MWQTETDGDGGCVFRCVVCVFVSSAAHTQTHTHARMHTSKHTHARDRMHAEHNECGERKKSPRRIMYAPVCSPQPRVSLHLAFNCYKLSHLTPSSLPFTTGPQRRTREAGSFPGRHQNKTKKKGKKGGLDADSTAAKMTKLAKYVDE